MRSRFFVLPLVLSFGLAACCDIPANPYDVDGDGYVSVETGGDDCNDQDGAINPGAVELCDEIDNNCDGQVDETSAFQGYLDADGDGYGSTPVAGCAKPDGLVEVSGDCDDTNTAVHPDAAEVCDWIPDNNCDGILDTGEIDGSYDANGDGDYDDEGDTYETGGPDGYTWCFMYFTQVDEDGDGYCDGGVDNNHDGDCTDPGDVIYSEDQNAPDSHVDCAVTDATVYPGAPELCDGKDNDCNSATIEVCH